jgi:hypothetical protein
MMSRPIIQFRGRVLAGFLTTGMLLLLVLLAGCDLFKENEGSEPAIRTDKQIYALSKNGETLTVSISMTYTNRTGEPTHLLTCNGIFSIILEKLVESKWVLAYGSDMPDCLGPIISLKPGRQHPYTLNVLAFSQASENDPKFEVNPIAGTYHHTKQQTTP